MCDEVSFILACICKKFSPKWAWPERWLLMTGKQKALNIKNELGREIGSASHQEWPSSSEMLLPSSKFGDGSFLHENNNSVISFKILEHTTKIEDKQRFEGTRNPVTLR